MRDDLRTIVDLGPVHMNGRIYDTLLGRVLSADLVVQYPGDLQSYNRYSYVRNNPLTLVDPSGFQDATTAEALLLTSPVTVPAIVEGAPVAAAVVGGGLAAIGFYVDANETAGMRTAGGGSGAPCIYTINAIVSQNAEAARKFNQANSSTNQQAASNAANTPKAPAEQKAEPAKIKEGASGGQMNSQEPPNKDKETSKERRVRQQEESRDKKHGDKDYEEPKSEDYAKWKAKEKAKADGKDARRKAHDVKNEGGRDRTKKELDEDYEIKNKPKKTPPPQSKKQGDEFEN